MSGAPLPSGGRTQIRPPRPSISHHRLCRWYEEGPLKGPLVEVQFTPVLILLELLLLTDVAPDLLLIQPDGAHAVSPRPEAPAEQRPFRGQQLPVDPGRTLALQIPDCHRNAVAWGHT